MLQLIQSPFNGLGVDMVLTRLRQGNPYRIGDHGIIFNNQNIHEICSFSAVFSAVHPEKTCALTLPGWSCMAVQCDLPDPRHIAGLHLAGNRKHRPDQNSPTVQHFSNGRAGQITFA